MGAARPRADEPVIVGDVHNWFGGRWPNKKGRNWCDAIDFRPRTGGSRSSIYLRALRVFVVNPKV